MFYNIFLTWNNKIEMDLYKKRNNIENKYLNYNKYSINLVNKYKLFKYILLNYKNIYLIFIIFIKIYIFFSFSIIYQVYFQN